MTTLDARPIDRPNHPPSRARLWIALAIFGCFFLAVQVLRSHDPNYLQLRQLEYERLIAAWPTISLALEHFDANLIAEEISSILEQRKGGGDA